MPGDLNPDRFSIIPSLAKAKAASSQYRVGKNWANKLIKICIKSFSKVTSPTVKWSKVPRTLISKIAQIPEKSILITALYDSNGRRYFSSTLLAIRVRWHGALKRRIDQSRRRGRRSALQNVTCRENRAVYTAINKVD